MSYKARRWCAAGLLVIGLPLYIILCVTVLNWIERGALLIERTIWIEFFVYVALGVMWVFPFKFIFKGVGQADPDGSPHKFDDDL